MTVLEWFFTGGVVVVLWLAHSAFRPYARCWMCKGSPRHASSSGRTWRKCWACGGRGERLRVGKRLIDNALARGRRN